MWPEVRVSDSFVLPSYLVYLSLLFTTMILVLPLYARWKRMDVIHALNISVVLLVVGFIGARLFHVFYEEWPIYRAQPERILYVWLGGFVFLGGAIPAVIAAAFYLRWKKLPWNEWSDFFAPIGAIGYGLGRISCFLSGCCYGGYCDLPWSVNGRHPTQLYAVAYELIVAYLLLRFFSKIKNRLGAGAIFWIWVLLHASGRVFIEGLRADFRGPLIFGFTISAFLCLVLVTFSVYQISLRFLDRQEPNEVMKRAKGEKN